MKAKLNSRELLINGEMQPESVRALVYSKFLNDTVHAVDIDYVYKDTEADRGAPPLYPSNHDSYSDQARQYLDQEQQYLRRERAYLESQRKYLAQHKNYSDQQQNYKSAEAAIKLDLIKDGLVSDTNHIQFTINEKEFILNGVTQSPEVHQRYLDKYCPAKGAAGWSWRHSTNRP